MGNEFKPVLRDRGVFRLLLLLGLLLFKLPVVQASGQAEMQLQGFFNGLRTLTARFDQQVNDDDGALIQHSRGRLWLQRPGRFRWDYQQPYRQLIVSDGEQVWVYDEDLEQVTEQAVDATIGQTPALLLSSDTPILDSFRITSSGEADGAVWLTLQPRSKDTAFRDMRLTLRDGKLYSMELRDGLGHTTMLEFTDVERNVSIDPQRFIFVPPPGVDVLRDVGQGSDKQD